MLRSLPGYLKIASMTAQIPVVYRGNFVMHFVGVMLQVFLLKMIWTAVYAGQESVDGVSLETTIAFLTLANLQVWLLFPIAGQFLQEQIRDGKVALELARPLPFIRMMVMRQVGFTAGIVPLILLCLPPALVVGGLQAPASPSAAGLYVVSLALAFGIATCTGLLVGLTGFWLVEIWGVQEIYFIATQFFAGAFVPLWFFPGWLRTLSNLLPFQTQAYLPLAMYFGQLRGADAARALGLQLFWVVALYALAWLVWRRALHRVVIQGG